MNPAPDLAAALSLADDDIEGLVRWAVASFGADLKIACSLSVEDCLLVHVAAGVAAQLGVTPTVFVLDTGRLPPESYEVLEALRTRYALPIAVQLPQTHSVESLLRAKGPFSFFESVEARRECCTIRKVEPLDRALAGARAWMTGLRRAQSPSRVGVERVEQDGARVKISPLALIDDAALWQRAEQLGVVVHPLHRRGYPSIGCQPCTRAVADGEDPRAGRWWWESPEHKECGIHRLESARMRVAR